MGDKTIYATDETKRQLNELSDLQELSNSSVIREETAVYHALAQKNGPAFFPRYDPDADELYTAHPAGGVISARTIGELERRYLEALRVMGDHARKGGK